MVYTTYYLIFGIKFQENLLKNIIQIFYDKNINNVRSYYKSFRTRDNDEKYPFAEYILNMCEIDDFFEAVLGLDNLFVKLYQGDYYFGVRVWDTDETNLCNYEIAGPIVSTLSEDKKDHVAKSAMNAFACCKDIIPEINYYWCTRDN